jgi:hypothetical protein
MHAIRLNASIVHLAGAPPHSLFILLSDCETSDTEILGYIPDHSIAEVEPGIYKDRGEKRDVDQDSRAVGCCIGSWGGYMRKESA